MADTGNRSQWEGYLNGYDEVLLSRVYRGDDIRRMRLLTDWHEIYGDSSGVVFVRDTSV